MIAQVKKRDGSVVRFEKNKITNAIFKAARAVGGTDIKLAEELSNKVLESLHKERKFSPTVEEVQDAVEKVLIEGGHVKTAKAYILYRQKRAEMRQEKMLILEKEEIDEVDKRFDPNALRVLKARYLRKDENGKLIETPKQLFTRVATHGALPDLMYDKRLHEKEGGCPEHEYEYFDHSAYDKKISIGKFVLNMYHLEAVKRMYDRSNRECRMKLPWGEFLRMLLNKEFDSYEKNIDDFYNIMTHRKFMPNTPAIANFGSVLGMGSACFTIDIEDSIDDIMEKLKQTAIVFKSGGGMGYNFSKLRPDGDFVRSTCGIASGPITFMKLFDTMTEVIKQGGIRRGANMGIMNSNHPDIEKFITAKEGNKALRNFNISILIMSDFWDHYEKNEPYPLVNPKSGKIVKYVDPRKLFDKVVYQAWESAEPGVLFFDNINKYNPFLKHLGPVVTTNPCVAADTLVSTENGLERIDSISAENITVDNRLIEINSGNQKTLQIGTQLTKPLQIVKTGIKETYKLKTRSGYELIATPDHRIMTSKGWTELKDITENDFVFIQSGEGRFSGNRKLPFDVNNTYRGKQGRIYETNLPTEWSEDLGFVLGWLVGDGFISERYNTVGLVFAPEDEEARAIIQPIFEKYCNRKIKPAKYENGCIQLRSNSKHITEFFLKLGYNSKERDVPRALFTAPKEAVLGFLSGVFSSDGTIKLGKKSRNYTRLNSSSMELLKNVQLLLLNLGIRSSIYDRSTKPKLFTYENKAGETVSYETSGTNYELNVSKKNLSKFIELVTFFQKKNKDKIDALLQFEFYREQFLDKIKSIEPAGIREVWDITEPQTHSFIANGIVVHNCGEVLLYGNESCNLGSVNVWAFAQEDGTIDWDDMKKTIMLGEKFLDNVIDVNKFPLKQIEEMTLATRKTGLGIMGVGDLLYELGIPYNTDEGRNFMERLMEFINYWSKVEAIELAKERGSMLYYDKSFYPEGRMPFSGFDDRSSWHFDWDEIAEKAKTIGMRNGFTTVIAPTGSISMIAGCSSGIEPVYSICFEKNVKVGSFFYVDPAFEKVMQREGLLDTQLMEDIATHGGTVQTIPYLSEKMKSIFVTANDITPEDHIRALAAFQRWTDSSISKTNNFPASATVEYMRESYLLAYKLGCKGCTVFRDSSIQDQVLVAPKKAVKVETPLQHAVAITKIHTETSSMIEQIDDVSRKLSPTVAETNGTIIPVDDSMHMMPVGEVEPFTNPTIIEGNDLDKFEPNNVEYDNLPSHKADIKNCPSCDSTTVLKEGCVSCTECGWGLCS